MRFIAKLRFATSIHAISPGRMHAAITNALNHDHDLDPLPKDKHKVGVRAPSTLSAYLARHRWGGGSSTAAAISDRAANLWVGRRRPTNKFLENVE